MHKHDLTKWVHQHNFSFDESKSEKKTLIVILITAIMMLAEIVGGFIFGSMALLADGWHMGTHVAAFGITIFAYRYSRKHQGTEKFTFGPGKVNVLGGFASSIALLMVALVMMVESVMRLFDPHEIQFNNAIIVAILGLLINGVCAIILHSKDHHHHHSHHHHHEGHDHNLKAAYFHVLADAVTSLTAILGLFTAKYFGWIFMDALMGIVGCLVITKWAFGLLKETCPILLDQKNQKMTDQVTRIIENESDNSIVDLHIWRVSGHHFAIIMSIVTHFPKEASHYKKLLEGIEGLSHFSIEVNRCEGEPCHQIA